MEHKQKMIALGAGAAGGLLLLVLAIVLLANGCGSDAPAATTKQTAAPTTENTLPTQTEPPATSLPIVTEPAITQQPETTVFRDVNETVTAKIKVNLRDRPSQAPDSVVLSALENGQWITRTGISENGWSRLERGGLVYYAVTSYLTTDLNYTPVQEEEVDDGINTVFTACSDQVTAKELVNLRSIPSVTREDSVTVAQLTKGEWITRTGINTDVGWSRVMYNGQTLYCITSYLETEVGATEETTAPTQ